MLTLNETGYPRPSDCEITTKSITIQEFKYKYLNGEWVADKGTLIKIKQLVIDGNETPIGYKRLPKNYRGLIGWDFYFIPFGILMKPSTYEKLDETSVVHYLMDYVGNMPVKKFIEAISNKYIAVSKYENSTPDLI
jgi:hypothetical protein